MIFRDQIGVFSQPGAIPAEALEDLIRQVRELDMDDVRKQIAEHRDVRGTLGRYPAIFGKMTSDGIDQLGALPHQQVTGPEHQA